MEDDAAEPGRPLSPEEAAERLRKLEAEAAQLREALNQPTAEPETPAELGPELEPQTVELTPERLAEAEKLLQRYRLEYSRGNQGIATKLLEEANTIAPGSSMVLEVMGDDAVARKRPKEAMDYYLAAKKADPKNISADKKHADLVYNTTARLSTTVASEYESLASAKTATIFSVILPGLGHAVTGQLAAGIGFMAVYIGFLVWTLLTPDGIRGLVAMISNRSQPPFNAMVLVPMVGAFVTWLISLTTIGAKSKTMAARISRPDAPKPPVDLPFE